MPIASQTIQIERLAFVRRRLQDDLELIIMLQPVGVFAIAPIGRPARRLDIGGAPRIRAQRPQGRGGMEGARAHLDVVGLQDHAALLGPEILQTKDQRLEAVAKKASGGQCRLLSNTEWSPASRDMREAGWTLKTRR